MWSLGASESWSRLAERVYPPPAPMDREASREREELVREALAAAGAEEALVEALGAAGASELPREPEELGAFLEGPLIDALVGRVHPVTARAIVDELTVRLERSEGAAEQAATVPPPPLVGDDDTYDDLATGAVHTRSTPAWGLRRTGEGDALVPTVWLLVSSDEALIELARQDAPAATEVIGVSSMAVLKGALGREGAAVCVVLDAGAPSISLDRAIAAITEDGGPARILLWRMDDDARERLSLAVPMVRTWLACEAEVTPREIVQLLGA